MSFRTTRRGTARWCCGSAATSRRRETDSRGPIAAGFVHVGGRAVGALPEPTGHLGDGSSGFRYRKLADTLTSIGAPAPFRCSSCAGPRGLWFVVRDAVVLVIGIPGESDELMSLLTYLEDRKIAAIALVGNEPSTLARHVEAVLAVFTEPASGTVSRAPTDRASPVLAFGSALAMTARQSTATTRGPSAEDNRPGLVEMGPTLTIRDLIPHPEHPAVVPDASWLAVVRAISRGGIGAVTVEEPGAHLVGLVTDGDLRRTIQRVNGQVGSLHAHQFMTREPVVLDAGARVDDAVGLLQTCPSEISVLPIVQGETCIGVIRLCDLLGDGD